MTIQEVKKDLNLTDSDIGKAFGYKNAHSYYQSARRKKIEAGVIEIYKLSMKAYFKCDACPETFNTFTELVEHVKIK
jgi:hypothetical protein